MTVKNMKILTENNTTYNIDVVVVVVDDDDGDAIFNTETTH
jgi:hypothetical protein